jgi:hypothetical protein
MFKLQFYRCEAPRPSPVSAIVQGADQIKSLQFRPKVGLGGGAFAFTGASTEQQALWEAIYGWLHPASPVAAAAGAGAESSFNVAVLAGRVASPDCPDITRLGSAYILGHAAARTHREMGAAPSEPLSALLSLLVHPWNVAARCAHFGIAAAGQVAVEPLCDLLERTSALVAAGDDSIDGNDNGIYSEAHGEPAPSDTFALVSHALGESVRLVTPRVIDVMCDALTVSLHHLNEQVDRITRGTTSTVVGPVRTGVNVGRSDGNGADRRLSLAVRAAAAATHALGMVAERTILMSMSSAAAVAGKAAEAEGFAARILQSLLPVSLTADPALAIPGERLSHDNSRFWLAEAAAYGILRLCSGSKPTINAINATTLTSGVQTVGLQVVTPTCPAHHSDQRYAPALCIAALGRLRHAVAAGAAPIPQLLCWLEDAQAEVGWKRMAAEASTDNPEPWLPSGVSGVAWGPR